MPHLQFYGLIAVFGMLLTAAGLCEAASKAPDDAVAKAARTPNASPAKGMFLLARRNLPDPNFRRTLVFLLRHGDNGTLGLVVNRRTKVKLSEAIPQIKGADARERTLFWGGPVAPSQVMFLLRDDRTLESSERVVGDVYVGTHPKLLEQLFDDDKSERDLRVFAGYASWASGQLSAELSRGDWHLLQVDAQIAFSTDVESLWETLIERQDPRGILVFGDPAQPANLILVDDVRRPDPS